MIIISSMLNRIETGDNDEPKSSLTLLKISVSQPTFKAINDNVVPNNKERHIIAKYLVNNSFIIFFFEAPIIKRIDISFF